MTLSDIERKRLQAAAEERGLDPDEVVREAEALRGGSGEQPQGNTGGAPQADINSSDPSKRLIADRMLIGFLPYVTVHEFRSIWLKMDTRLPDDHLPTGEWLRLHGQVAAATPADSGRPSDDDSEGRDDDAGLRAIDGGDDE